MAKNKFATQDWTNEQLNINKDELNLKLYGTTDVYILTSVALGSTNTQNADIWTDGTKFVAQTKKVIEHDVVIIPEGIEIIEPMSQPHNDETGKYEWPDGVYPIKIEARKIICPSTLHTLLAYNSETMDYPIYFAGDVVLNEGLKYINLEDEQGGSISIGSLSFPSTMESFKTYSVDHDIVMPANLDTVDIWTYEPLAGSLYVNNPNMDFRNVKFNVEEQDGPHEGTIYGYAGSTAEKYAKEHEYKFVNISSDYSEKIKELEDNKVDKDGNKQLSTEDYTKAEKEKLARLENYDDTAIKQDIVRIDNNFTHKADLIEGKIPASQLPSYVDDVIEGKRVSDTSFTVNDVEIKAEPGKIYLDIDTNRQYRWSGSKYAEISSSLALGETESTAYPGAKGQKNAKDIIELQSKKVDKVDGKGLSTNDYTTEEKNKLAGLENYELPDDVVQDENYVHTDNNYTTEEKNKLAGLKNYELPNDVVRDTKYVHTDNNYTTEEKEKLAGLENYELPDDVVQDADYKHTDNNYTDEDKEKVKSLDQNISNAIANLVGQAPETLDTLEEIANTLGENKNAATEMLTLIGNKVDKVDGKGLSTNDFTSQEKEKLANLENYVLPSDVVQDENYVHTDNNYTTAEMNKLAGLLKSSYMLTDEDITVTDGVVTAFLKNDFSEYEAIIFPEGVTEIRLPDAGGETPLVANKVIMPRSLKVIGDSSFSNWIKLENDEVIESTVVVKVKEFVLNEGLETIEQYAFSDNVYLENINIPEGVKVIGEGAFGGSDSLKSIKIPTSVVTIGDGNFVPTNAKAENATVIYGYADSEAEKYATSTNSTKPFVNKFVNLGNDYQQQISKSSNALKGEAFGKVLNINDISPIEHELELKVVSNNILPYPYFWNTKIQNGISYTVNNDGSITVDGTSSAFSAFYLTNDKGNINDLFEDGMIYTIGTMPTNISLTVIAYDKENNMNKYYNKGNRNTTFTIDKNKYDYKWMQIQIEENRTVENVTIYPQVVLGEVSTLYTPYVSDINMTSIIIQDANGTDSTYTPDTAGYINGIKSIYPHMTIKSSEDNVLVICRYNRDINSIDKNLESLKMLHQNKLRDIYRAKALGGDVDDDVALQNYIDDETYIYIPQGTYRLKKPLVIRKYGTVLQGEGYGFRTSLVPYNQDVEITIEKNGTQKGIKTLIYVKNESGNSMMFTIRDICFRTYTSSGDETIPNENYHGYCIASDQYIIDSKIENCWFNGGGTTVVPIKDENNNVTGYKEDTTKLRINSTAISLNAIHTIISGCWFECFDTAIHLGQEADPTNRNSNGYLITNCDFWCNLNAIEVSGRGAIRNCHFSSMQGGFAVRGFNNCLVQVSDCTAWLTRPEVDILGKDTLLFTNNKVGKVVIADDASHLFVRGLSVNETIANGSAYNTVFCANDTSHLEVRDCDLCEGDINEPLVKMADNKKIESVSPNFRFELEFKELPENVVCAVGSKIHFTTPNSHTGAIYTSKGWRNFGGEQELANSLKGKSAGEEIILEDVSPNEHFLDIKVKSLNTIPYPYYNGNAKTHNGITYTVQNDGSIIVDGTSTDFSVFYLTDSKGSIDDLFEDGKTYTIGETPKSIILTVVAHEKGTTNPYYYNKTYADRTTFKVDKSAYDYKWLQIQINGGKTFENAVVEPQVVEGTQAGNYIPTNKSSFTLKRFGSDETDNLKEYSPNVDGTVTGVKSLYPITTLTIDAQGTTIECEYNRDINKAFEELQKAILALNGTE